MFSLFDIGISSKDPELVQSKLFETDRPQICRGQVLMLMQKVLLYTSFYVDIVVGSKVKIVCGVGSAPNKAMYHLSIYKIIYQEQGCCCDAITNVIEVVAYAKFEPMKRSSDRFFMWGPW